MTLVVCFISIRQRLGDIKTQNSFHRYRMKWKFISDPIYMPANHSDKNVNSANTSNPNCTDVLAHFLIVLHWLNVIMSL